MDNKIIAIVVAAIVVVAGVGVYFFLDNDNNSNIDLLGNDTYLEIFGNANGDHLLNNDDVNIIQDYIDRKITESDLIQVEEDIYNKTYYLADANIDGVVDAKDITYLKSIMDRSGKNMSFIDSFGYLVTVPLKIDRIASDYLAIAELLQLVGVQDKIVAAVGGSMALADYYLQGVPDINEVVNYKSRTSPDFEAVAETNPDVWVVSGNYTGKYQKNTNATVFALDMLTFDFDDIYSSSTIVSALIAGYVFDNMAAAEKYVEWYLETWEMLNSKSSTLSKEDRPTVFYTGYGNYIIDPNDKKLRIFLDNTVCWQAVKLAGGYNIIDDYPGELTPGASASAGVSLEIEWIADQEYDYLFAHSTRYSGGGSIISTVPDHGYTCDDNSEYKAGQAHLGEVDMLTNSCKPSNMYLTPGDYMNGASGGLLTAVLVATVINADLYPDLDLMTEHQKYIDLMGFDYDVSKNGVFFVNN